MSNNYINYLVLTDDTTLYVIIHSDFLCRLETHLEKISFPFMKLLYEDIESLWGTALETVEDKSVYDYLITNGLLRKEESYRVDYILFNDRTPKQIKTLIAFIKKQLKQLEEMLEFLDKLENENKNEGFTIH